MKTLTFILSHRERKSDPLSQRERISVREILTNFDNSLNPVITKRR
jgi:hypothetical protein